MLHVDKYRENIAEIERLLAIHEVLTGVKRGYRSDVEVLNKSAIVLLVACWEAFVEDLAQSAFEFLLTNAVDHKAFPPKVLTLASKTFWESKDERAVWKLAGGGWKIILSEYKEAILKEHLGSFNTPRALQIDTLFQRLLGMSHLSSHWRWRKMSTAQARSKLGSLVTLRGEVAHRVSASRSVKKEDVRNYGSFIGRLTVISSNVVREFIHRRVGKYPWNEVYLTTD